MKCTLLSASLRLAVVLCLAATVAFGAEATANLTNGKANLQSASQLAFGPDGIMFVGDSLQGAVFAIDSEDRQPASSAVKIEVKAINAKIAAMLGTQPDQILINDIEVNPISKKVYLAVSRGRGPDAIPVLFRVDGSGKITEFQVNKVNYAVVSLADLPESKPTAAPVVSGGPVSGNPRAQTITDMDYLDGKLLVAGLTSEEFSSDLRVIPYPFQGTAKGSGIKIWHAAHGRYETASPVRTFIPYMIDNQPHILASYACTPLVKIPMKDLKPGAKVQGTTIAELGSGNRPLDMVPYSKNGRNYVLIANRTRGVMKMTADDLGSHKAIEPPNARCAALNEGDQSFDECQVGVAGVPYETISSMKGVWQLAKVDENTVLLLSDSNVKEDGKINLGPGQATWATSTPGMSLDLTTAVLP